MGVAAHEQRNTDNAFTTDAGGFGRRARLGHIVQRDDAGGREISVLQLSAGFVKHLPERHRNQFQLRRQRLEFSRRQGGEKMVLIRTVRS